MGLSWTHKVTLVCKEIETEWVKRMPKRFPLATTYSDGPVELISHVDKLITITSGGYGIFDLNEISYPDSLVGVVHRISPNQGQEFDIVDEVSIESLIPEEEEDDDCLRYEGCDPGSDYWTEGNPELNIYSDEPTFSDLMSDYEGPDEEEETEYNKRYEQWMTKQQEAQEKDYEGLVRELLKQTK